MSAASEFESMAAAMQAADVPGLARCLQQIATMGLPEDLLSLFLERLTELLADSGDSDRVVANLQRFLAASRSPQSWLALFEREPDALQVLVQLFSASQYMAEVLIADPEAFDLLRMTGGQPVAKAVLQDEIQAEVEAAPDSRAVMRILRDYRRRETLRIAYGDLLLGQPVEVVTEQISILAEAILQAAVIAARREMDQRRAPPRLADGRLAGFCVIALGKLGGAELNYSSDLDLLFIYQTPAERAPGGRASSPAPQTEEYFQRLGQQVIKLLSESTSRGIAYRIDMRLRPYGLQGGLAINVERALEYYDSAGRTWERQAFVKARPVAGDLELGASLIQQLQPWIYRRYLMRADITGLAALKRRIEKRAREAGDDERNVKLGHGGIRDIEFVIQFLQLLHGGDLPSLRTQGTLDSIRQLQQAGCLTAEEQSILEDNYRFLRRIEHYLQIQYDRKTHLLPSDSVEFAKVAKRLGYRDGQAGATESAAESFRHELHQRTQRNRRILDHLLHEAFDDETEATAESDLVLDPEPNFEVIQSTLAPFGFADAQAAYRHLQSLAVESIPFLSTRRCRHFLAAIAPRLLKAIAATPDPDATLISLAHVSDSLGGKAVLWELFSLNPPSMELCVRLCACSPYLAGILTSNPGMIDELLDSLMLSSLPSVEELSQSLAELCSGAVDIAPILQSFKNSMHLRVGVRDLLGKETIVQTHAALSDIAEACLEQVIHHEFHRLMHQLGIPMRRSEAGGEEPAELVVLAVGKLGGREPNYHSDLDIIFLFDGEGQTKSLVPSRRFEPTTNRHFFNQLCQRVIHAVTRVGNTGRLYNVDVRLRPLGRNGELAIGIADLKRYFAEGGGEVWERQALCKARPIWGSPRAQAETMNCVHEILSANGNAPQLAQQIRQYRLQLQKGASPSNLKRGEGGTMDVEFIVQLLQLSHAHTHSNVLVPGTLEALQRLCEADLIDAATARELSADYQALRRIESAIRLMNMSARHELPSDRRSLRQLAFLMGTTFDEVVEGEAPEQAIAVQCDQLRRNCRNAFERIFAEYLPESVVTE